MMCRVLCAIAWVVFLGGSVLAEEPSGTKVIVEMSKPLPPPEDGVLGTMDYPPTDQETPFLKKITEPPIDLMGFGSGGLIPIEKYKLEDQAGQYVGWFGIVRKKTYNEKEETTTLLLEHQYFDGLTDLHLQVVSLFGAGDYTIVLPGKAEEIPSLGLVRVYGKVVKGEDGLAQVTPEYVRVWDWGQFTFMGYGKDKTNPEWLKLRKIDPDDIHVYSSRPTRRYYEDRLGKRESTDSKPKKTD